MVICIDEKLITSLPHSLDTFYNNHPSLKANAFNFRDQSIIDVKPENYLYVHQGEFAVIPSNDKTIKVVGSDDATTCHILILKHPSGTCAVTHLDGRDGEVWSIKQMFNEIMMIEGRLATLDAFVIGGYNAPSGSKVAVKDESQKLSLKLLNTFINEPFTINIALWCTCSFNTTYRGNEPFPALYGLAFDRVSQKVIPASFPNLCFCFKLRSALQWLKNFSNPYNLYDYNEKTITIPLFPEWNHESFKFYVNLPDNLFMNNFSTSPSVEPPKAIKNMKAIFHLLGSTNVSTLFPNGSDRKFHIGSSGKWEEV